MIQNITSAKCRTNRISCTLIGVAALALGGNISAEVEEEVGLPTDGELDVLVVSAWRMPGKVSEATSAVTVLDPEEFEERGIFDLRQALNEIPGVIATSTGGQTGAAGSVFIRGTTTAYSQLVVDGMRVSDSNTSMGTFLAGARLEDLSTIEVLRGPQAAIHGGESVGGVIWLETARGEGDAKTQLRLEGGSFGSFNGFLSNAGQEGALSWFVGAGYDGTHNDAVGEDFDQVRGSLRLEWAQSDTLTMGMTYRAIDSRFQYQFFGTNTDHVDADLLTVYANAQLTPDWTARFTLGRYAESYYNDYFGANFGTDLDRTVLSTDQSYTLGDDVTLLGGAFLEYTDFANTFNTASNEVRYGAHFGAEWQAHETVLLDAVVRWEDYVDFGDQITWRVGGSWLALEQTRFRAGIGKAFRTPSFQDRYGSTFGLGDPNLAAEESLGWDLGVEQKLGDHHRVSLTYFENSIKNRIQNTFVFPLSPPPVNLSGKTPTRGYELALGGELGETLGYRVSYTHLTDSLVDQPENTATASLDWRPVEKLLLGIGATYVDTRSYGGAPLDDYLLLRLYGSYEVSENLTLHGRVENIADQQYELSNFGGTRIPGAGIGFYGGLTATF
ncbi:MAG: TonB-dependent receptor [Akkermansiaceae bacterium]|jgi:vitamin B12 transporter|nr:TonB-dependent receptor [Akkermansiaceae bacterium]MDP4721770.1 TonB-dependent receptor [Akkermansiaceae bacterium]MDP4780138.1 TonB-dependent receptor [Akkermansiaceae bacterium]MDP4848371.1 TonB-dependent receptor [Akkermansiaceae bacterium]MDP4898372.1 TonB-dependent receptor [Akkermansiaceae bacterium]